MYDYHEQEFPLFFFAQNKKSNVNKTPTTVRSIHFPTLEYWIGTCFIPVIPISFRLSVMIINYVHLATCLLALRAIFMFQPVKKQKRTQMNPFSYNLLFKWRSKFFKKLLSAPIKYEKMLLLSFLFMTSAQLVFLHWPPAALA